MATKKEKAAVSTVDAEKEAKKKARMEKLKNRPAGQRTNSKQIDVIDLGNGKVVKNFGYPVKNKSGYQGVLVTSVTMDGDNVLSSSTSFVPGNLTVKVKKGHGTIVNPKVRNANDEVEEAEED